MRIVVGGYIIGYPLGGMTWHHLNYLLGLHQLGHEICFLEDSGEFSVPYDPQKQICDADSSFGRAYLQRTFEHYGLPLRYCYYSQFEDKYYGMTGAELDEYLRTADLLLCVSGVTPLRAERPRPRRTLVIDTDPVFTQVRMCHDSAFLEYFRSFDAVATFGRLIGTRECELPTHGINWIPTNQPIALRNWPVSKATSRAFTTIGKWEHATDRHIEFAGRRILSSKAAEWLKLKQLPHRVSWKMTLGMQGMPAEVASDFRGHGWSIVDSEKASSDPQAYARFITESAGEFTVAKQIYAELPSGWFSDRSAAYLAAGRPVVTQDSGFDHWLPTGKGLFSYKTLDDAAEALNNICQDYPAHAAAARDIAERHFDASVVLNELLTRVM